MLPSDCKLVPLDGTTSTFLNFPPAWEKKFLDEAPKDGRIRTALQHVAAAIGNNGRKETLGTLYLYTHPQTPEFRKRERWRIMNEKKRLRQLICDAERLMKILDSTVKDKRRPFRDGLLFPVFSAHDVMEVSLARLLQGYIVSLRSERATFLKEHTLKGAQRDERWIVELMVQLETNTGDAWYKELAILVNAGHRAHGEKAEVSADSLRKIRIRYPKTHPRVFAELKMLTLDPPEGEVDPKRRIMSPSERRKWNRRKRKLPLRTYSVSDES